MMPKMDGWEACREIRKISKVPIIMLTAKGDERDELQGFQLGVDEYITKPFSPKILVARVEAVLRRYHKTETMIQVNNVTIDTASHRVTLDGEEIYLTGEIVKAISIQTILTLIILEKTILINNKIINHL